MRSVPFSIGVIGCFWNSCHPGGAGWRRAVGNTAVGEAALGRGSGGFGVIGRQVIAQKQMWHGTDLPNPRAGVSASSRRGRR